MTGSPVPIPVISAAGITLPTYNQVLLGYQQGYANIYGSDVSIEPDDLDGQWIAVQAQAYFDLCQMIGVMYNLWGVLNTTGPMLDNICALTNTQRQNATNSTAVVTIVGTAYSVITNGVIGDNQNLQTTWNLPATVTIPSGGSISVTATCETSGAITAIAASLVKILTPTAGWQTVTNPVAAIPGVALETDAQLIQQQQLSVASGSVTPIEAIAAAVANVPGVSQVSYFNNTSSISQNGVPPGQFTIIVAGGLVESIATAIASKKPPGIISFGTTSAVVTDINGVPETINFYEQDLVELQVQITLKASVNYQAQTGIAIQNAILSYFSAFLPGQASFLNDLFVPAKLNNTYTITNIQQTVVGGGLGSYDILALIYEKFFIKLTDITIIVT